MTTHLTWVATCLLFLAACNRGFTTPTPPPPLPPSVSSLALDGVSGFTDGQIVLSGETLRVTGQVLAGATATVGGITATVLDSDHDHLDLVVPTPSSSTIGVSSAVQVSVGTATLTAGHVTVYAVPLIASAAGVPEVGGAPDGGAEMVAPGLAVIEGQNFSPRAEEDVVLFEGAAAEVVVAQPNRLLVNLAASLASGPVALSLAVTPDSTLAGGARIAAQLNAGRRAYLWETVPDSWPSPAAVLPHQTVLLRAGGYPTAFAAQLDTYGEANTLLSDGGDAPVPVVSPPLGLR